MTRETSLEIYKKIKESGMLSKRRFQVYECIVLNGRLTMYEVLKFIKFATHQGVSGRFSELERMGVIFDTGERRKNEHGNNCIVWDTTSRLPEKFQKDKTTKELLQEANDKIIELTEEIRRLKKANAQQELSFK